MPQEPFVPQQVPTWGVGTSRADARADTRRGEQGLYREAHYTDRRELHESAPVRPPAGQHHFDAPH
eukprot:36231-Pleurochrysis_carterae.AAC.1